MTNYKEIQDLELCRLASQGDLEAEEALILRYHFLVRICARPYYLAGGDTEDLIQEGMVGLLQAVRGYTDQRQASFRTYAETCIKNRLLSAIKGANRGKHSPLNEALSLEQESGDGPRQAQSKGPEEMLISKETVEELMEQVKATLSSFERKVFQQYLDGNSSVQIAEELYKSTKSVDNAVQRIKKKVARYL